jgi:hypothetical protein
VDPGDFYAAGFNISAYAEFIVENSTLGGAGAFCFGDRAACGAACGLCVEIAVESIFDIGHPILHSGGVSLLCGVDGFGLAVFARIGDLEGA